MSDTTLIAVRHGETEWNRMGRMQGWAPAPLNERGRDQARAVGEWLAATYEVDRTVASDLRRTRETAALIRDAGVPAKPAFEAGWRERDMGRFQGFTREELYEGYPVFDYANGVVSLEARPAGGESILDLRERVLGAAADLCRRASGETVLVVTHGGPIAVLLAAATGDDLLSAKRRSMANCAVTALRGSTPESMDVLRENETV